LESKLVFLTAFLTVLQLVSLSALERLPLQAGLDLFDNHLNLK
jgi:hypothetical protein